MVCRSPRQTMFELGSVSRVLGIDGSTTRCQSTALERSDWYAGSEHFPLQPCGAHALSDSVVNARVWYVPTVSSTVGYTTGTLKPFSPRTPLPAPTSTAFSLLSSTTYAFVLGSAIYLYSDLSTLTSCLYIYICISLRISSAQHYTNPSTLRAH